MGLFGYSHVLSNIFPSEAQTVASLQFFPQGYGMKDIAYCCQVVL